MSLQNILNKLKVKSIEEFMEKEKKLDEKFNGSETERHPFSVLTREEMLYFRDCVNRLYFKKECNM